MITARIKAGKQNDGVKDGVDVFGILQWEDEFVDIFTEVNLAVSLEPFMPGQVARTTGLKYIHSYEHVPSCHFLDTMGKYNKEGHLVDIFFGSEVPDESD